MTSADDSGVSTPPAFSNCVEGKRERIERKLSDEALRKACAREWVDHKYVTAGYLIKREWSRREAVRRGIEPKKAAIRASINQQLREAAALVEQGDATIDRSQLPRYVDQLMTQRREARLLAEISAPRDAVRRVIARYNKRLTPAMAAAVLKREKLDALLVRRYADRTRCVSDYQRPTVPECVGRTRDYG